MVKTYVTTYPKELNYWSLLMHKLNYKGISEIKYMYIYYNEYKITVRIIYVDTFNEVCQLAFNGMDNKEIYNYIKVLELKGFPEYILNTQDSKKEEKKKDLGVINFNW